jgi:hypothetical protein
MSGFAQIAQIDIIVTKIIEFFVGAFPDLDRSRLAAPAFPHFPNELVIGHVDLCRQFLNPACHSTAPFLAKAKELSLLNANPAFDYAHA